MKRLNPDQALAIKDRKDGEWEGGGFTASPAEDASEAALLVHFRHSHPKRIEIMYAFSPIGENPPWHVSRRYVGARGFHP